MMNGFQRQATSNAGLNDLHKTQGWLLHEDESASTRIEHGLRFGAYETDVMHITQKRDQLPMQNIKAFLIMARSYCLTVNRSEMISL
jgi:hypothetical protein